MADNWVISPILPAISEDLGVSISSAALAISAFLIPFGFFQLLFGYLADIFGKKQIISVALVFFTISIGLCAISVGLWDLVIYRALTGFFAAAIFPLSIAMIGDAFPSSERQTAIGMFMGFSFFGQGISMAIGGAATYYMNWRFVFIIYALISIVTMILLFTAGKSIVSEKPSKKSDAKVFAPFLRLLKDPSSLKIYLLVLFEGIFLVGSFSFLGEFIKKTYHFNNLIIGFIMTAFGIMALIGGSTSGKVIFKVGRKNAVLIGFCSAALANLTYIAIGGNLVLFVVAVSVMGFGFMLAQSTLLTIASEFAAKSRGVAISLVGFALMGGGGLGTAIGGRILECANLYVLFAAYGTGLLLMIISVLAMKRSFETREE